MMMEKKYVQKIFRCPECSSDRLIEDHDQGEITCQTCGLVISEQKISSNPEWRAFTKEERDSRQRTGMPLSFAVPDKGLTTVIEQVNKDAFGKTLSLDTRRKMLSLRRWHRLAQPYIEKNLIRAMAELDGITNRLYIPTPIKENAAVIYRKALDTGLVRGRSIAAIVAASLYSACRSSETPRTLKEVSAASGLNKKDIARCYRLLLKELNIKMPVEDPIKCVSKIASRADVSHRVQMKAIDILKKAKLKGIVVGKDPMGLAAAALYVGCIQAGEKKTQKEMSEAANVTEVTVRNRYKNLKKTLNLEIKSSGKQ